MSIRQEFLVQVSGFVVGGMIAYSCLFKKLPSKEIDAAPIVEPSTPPAIPPQNQDEENSSTSPPPSNPPTLNPPTSPLPPGPVVYYTPNFLDFMAEAVILNPATYLSQGFVLLGRYADDAVTMVMLTATYLTIGGLLSVGAAGIIVFTPPIARILRQVANFAVPDNLYDQINHVSQRDILETDSLLAQTRSSNFDLDNVQHEKLTEEEIEFVKEITGQDSNVQSTLEDTARRQSDQIIENIQTNLESLYNEKKNDKGKEEKDKEPIVISSGGSGTGILPIITPFDLHREAPPETVEQLDFSQQQVPQQLINISNTILSQQVAEIPIPVEIQVFHDIELSSDITTPTDVYDAIRNIRYTGEIILTNIHKRVGQNAQNLSLESIIEYLDKIEIDVENLNLNIELLQGMQDIISKMESGGSNVQAIETAVRVLGKYKAGYSQIALGFFKLLKFLQRIMKNYEAKAEKQAISAQIIEKINAILKSINEGSLQWNANRYSRHLPSIDQMLSLRAGTVNILSNFLTEGGEIHVLYKKLINTTLTRARKAALKSFADIIAAFGKKK